MKNSGTGPSDEHTPPKEAMCEEDKKNILVLGYWQKGARKGNQEDKIKRRSKRKLRSLMKDMA